MHRTWLVPALLFAATALAQAPKGGPAPQNPPPTVAPVTANRVAWLTPLSSER